MPRKNSNFLGCGIEDEIDPKIKFKSLISVTVSTVMCLAAKCPLPKSNVETTKLFLSTITGDNGETPKNIKGFLKLLNNYSGPYDSDLYKEKVFEKAPVEKIPPKEKETCPPEPKEMQQESKIAVLSRETTTLTETQLITKRTPKQGIKRGEKDLKKSVKTPGSKISLSKSVISKS